MRERAQVRSLRQQQKKECADRRQKERGQAVLLLLRVKRGHSKGLSQAQLRTYDIFDTQGSELPILTGCFVCRKHVACFHSS